MLLSHLRRRAARAVLAAVPNMRAASNTRSRCAAAARSPRPRYEYATMGVRAPVSWPGFLLAATTGGAMLAYYFNQKEAKKERMRTEAKEVKGFGKPALGGPWSLVDQDGAPVTDADLRGNFVLLYFGFTHCPDICPAELVKMGAIVDAVDAAGKEEGEDAGRKKKIVPAMISIDPNRDTCAQMKHYLRDFHPRFVGLTGTPAQVKVATKAFRVFFRDTEPDRDPNDEDYLVDHSIVIYLLGPDGSFLAFMTQSVTAEEGAQKVLKHMAEFEAEAAERQREAAAESAAAAAAAAPAETQMMRRISKHEFAGSK